MKIYLMGTVYDGGKSIYSTFESPTSSEARRRAHLRLSVNGVQQVTLWTKDGVDWRWADTFLIKEETV